MNKMMKIAKVVVLVGGMFLLSNGEADASTYKVKTGDTLYNIAKESNTTVEEILELNNMKDAKIKIGQELKMSNEEEKQESFEKAEFYVVEKGDTITKISKKTNVSVSDLKEINSLINDKIVIGQMLILEKVGEVRDYQIHIVKKGDNLTNIAKQYGVSLKGLKEMNLEKLTIGQEVYVPNEKKVIKGDFKINGASDSHTIEFKNTKTSEFFALQVNEKQMKALKKKKSIKEVTIKGNELISYK